VSFVVDCIEGTVELYINGRPSGRLNLSAAPLSNSVGHVDGTWSLGDQFTLFGTKTAADCGNGAIRYAHTDNCVCLLVRGLMRFGLCSRLLVQTRCLLATEVEDLAHEMKREGETDLVNEIVTQLIGMGFSDDIARWAATQSEGLNMEDRLNSALSILS
jgi:hypothetical protein